MALDTKTPDFKFYGGGVYSYPGCGRKEMFELNNIRNGRIKFFLALFIGSLSCVSISILLRKTVMGERD